MRERTQHCGKLVEQTRRCIFAKSHPMSHQSALSPRQSISSDSTARLARCLINLFRNAVHHFGSSGLPRFRSGAERNDWTKQTAAPFGTPTRWMLARDDGFFERRKSFNWKTIVEWLEGALVGGFCGFLWSSPHHTGCRLRLRTIGKVIYRIT